MMAIDPSRPGCRPALAVCLFLAGSWPAVAGDIFESADPPGIPAEGRDDALPAALRNGNFLAVPIPTSNPTIGSGLIGVTGYFWGQTEAQAYPDRRALLNVVDEVRQCIGVNHRQYAVHRQRRDKDPGRQSGARHGHR